ncbi:DUF6328 family protein [Streptomyces sp. NPDC090025]|uniref:DUF6328 family protein n=1 Tax=Streptomyces sp. NPDC090025 TaxID=3365922 RepID=UPI0038336B76
MADDPPPARDSDPDRSDPDRPEPDRSDPDRHETADERADRNLLELLQELRVLQTGVQIVFAFLLGVAFTPRFLGLTDVQQDIYVAALLLTVIASALLASPVAIHRVLFRQGEKDRIVAWSARLARAGLVVLALALNTVLLLLLDVVIGRTGAVVVTCLSCLMFAGLWYVLPTLLRRR